VKKLAWFVLGLVLALPALADVDAGPRASYLALIDRPKVALKPELAELPAVEGLKKYHLWYSADASERVPGYLLLPDPKSFKGPRPVIIALHGTGGNKDNMANLVLKAARAGFIGVAIDGRFHGERTRAGNGSDEYNAAIAETFKTGKGHPFYFDTSWDVIRLVDYLVTRKDVDAARIGLTGISKGGIETYLAAAADPRIAVAVPVHRRAELQVVAGQRPMAARVSPPSRTRSMPRWCFAGKKDDADFVREFYARVAPGIDGAFDGPEMLKLIAPRPLLVVNADSDANTPIAGVRLAVRAAQPVYAANNASDRLQLMIEEDTPHRVNPEAVDAGIAWFVRWLNP
jgi:dienelactone hydrolase